MKPLYVVTKQSGHWGIIARGAPFLECISFQEAIEIARVAARLLSDWSALSNQARDWG